jgi:hypothetical protein
MILASCVINYAGPFEASYRQDLIEGKWQTIIATFRDQIKFSLGFDFNSAIGDVDTIQSWEIKGIPNDKESIQNMIILEQMESMKYPLLIDPQEQALPFMRLYLDNNYV